MDRLYAEFGSKAEPPIAERLAAWREIPYLSHEGYELPLLLEGRKPFARMSQGYPPENHFNEDRFDQHEEQGLIHKEVVVDASCRR